MKEVESVNGERIQRRVTKNTKNTGNMVFCGLTERAESVEDELEDRES